LFIKETLQNRKINYSNTNDNSLITNAYYKKDRSYIPFSLESTCNNCDNIIINRIENYLCSVSSKKIVDAMKYNIITNNTNYYFENNINNPNSFYILIFFSDFVNYNDIETYDEFGEFLLYQNDKIRGIAPKGNRCIIYDKNCYTNNVSCISNNLFTINISCSI
jgi:hypothetical protein